MTSLYTSPPPYSVTLRIGYTPPSPYSITKYPSIPLRSHIYSIALYLSIPVAPLYTSLDPYKNDRRNSGGTLRQKFNHIDFRHLTFNQWTNGPMD